MAVPYAEVIGEPIAHSKSPLIHKFWLEKLGMEGDYRATRIGPADLPAYLTVRRADPLWRGANLTMPLKTAALNLADARDAEAEAAGATNCIVPRDGRLRALNTDRAGFMAALPRIDAGTWSIIGTGGAARAALTVMAFLAVRRVHLLAQNVAKGGQVIASADMEGECFGFDRAERALRGSVALINATPLGMTGHAPMPERVIRSLGFLHSGAFVFDMVYAPPLTPLGAEAEALRLKTIGGLTMLIEQARHSFDAFYGAAPPRDHDAELRDLLTR